ncbi:MAG TPA: MerR family transcriptional regulator, partial [Solirubrobacteraceae bacterium]|nr:MerR family transcriptional regulator [Solirubrobacteraceae bacterium]
MERVDRGGQTVSATHFAGLTGVSRERLRTWERRYGFPEPRRVGSGPRRYAIEDVQRVVAVRRAAEAGVPIPHAIERTRDDNAPSQMAA